MIIKLLKTQDIQPAVRILLEQFEPEQPLTVTFAINYPNLQLNINQRKQLWTHWLQVSNQKELAIGIIDPINNQLSAVCICKDVNYELPQIQQEYTTTLTEEKCFIALEQYFLQRTSKQLREIFFIEGKVLEIMIIAVKKKYQGKGLSKLLIQQSEKIAKKKLFNYCYCQASNFKTAKSLMKSQFLKLVEMDLRQFEVLGVKPFYNISKEHNIASSWLKNIYLS